jgi:capsular polysaccharide biosynthesis protein
MPIVVRDCGPCSPWFDLLRKTNDVTAVSPGELSELARLFPGNVVVTEGLRQFARKRDGEKLVRFRDMFSPKTSESKNVRVMAVRSREPSFYASPESEVATSGSSRRRIGNEHIIGAMLQRRWSFRVVEFFELTPKDALETMTSCSTFVTQRGAAMMNLVFMPPGGAVVEIYPRGMLQSQRNIDLYRRACTHLGLKYVRLQQKSNFANVSRWRIAFALLRVKVTPPVGARE